MSQDALFSKFLGGDNLVFQIVIGIIAGIILAAVWPNGANNVAILGQLFVSALKAVAPILIFVLVISSISNQSQNTNSKMQPILVLYLIGTLSAAIIAVSLSFMFPTALSLTTNELSNTGPQGILEVMKTLILKVVDNPINALLNANFIGILAWSIGLGLLLRKATETTKQFLQDSSDAVTAIVRWVIRFAPLGVFGLVSSTLASTGFDALISYARLLVILVGTMLLVALVVNPIIVWFKTRHNPYPLVLRCLRESGITAFFTRSSAANIPVNLRLCEELGLDRDTYSVSIPLGATINMAGAAITITVMTLAAVNTLGIQVDFGSALLLCFVSAIAACGSSGVAGGSLLLIPLACSLFNIENDIAMQVVAVGFIIGVVQDSAETALNSSTDVVFTAAVSQSLKDNH